MVPSTNDVMNCFRYAVLPLEIYPHRELHYLLLLAQDVTMYYV